jgi:hypothetical protein
MMKNPWIAGLGLTALVLMAGCNTQTEQATKTRAEGGESVASSGDNAAKRDKALVRFVNAAPNQQTLDLWFGDTKAFSGVAYKTVSAYMELPTERRIFKVRTANGTTDLATNSEGLWDGRHYTFVAVPKDDGTITLHAMNDDLKAPEVGKAKVRVMNAAPKNDDLDIYVAGNKDEIFDGVDYNSVTDFKEIDPVTGLEVRKDNAKAAAVRVGDLAMTPGKMYTIIVTGGPGARLDTIRIEDQLTENKEAGL